MATERDKRRIKDLEEQAAREERRVYCDLPVIELAVVCCFVVYWYTKGVGLWFEVSSDPATLSWLERHLRPVPSWFSPGKTTWLRDESNFWWDFARKYLWMHWRAFLAHLVLNRAVKKVCPRFLPVFHTLETAFHTHRSLGGTRSVLYLLVPPAASYWLTRLTGSSLPTWAMAGYLMFERMMPGPMKNLLHKYFMANLSYEHQVILGQTVAWGMMRCVSSSVTAVERRSRSRSDEDQDEAEEDVTFFKSLGFFCYYPSSYLGPLATYDAYERGLADADSAVPLTFRHVLPVAWHVLRACAVLTAHDLLSHFVYVHQLASSASYLNVAATQRGSLALISLGGFEILNFSALYSATYRITQEIARVDGFEPVPYPKCLAHIYLYSDCWRNFDVGFYVYVKKYIYHPLCGGIRRSSFFHRRQFLALVVVYFFIFLYHGGNRPLLWWTLFNFLQVLAEAVVLGWARRSDKYKSAESLLPPSMVRRLHALCSVPSWFFGAVTLQYFFARNVQIGDIYVNRLVLKNSWSGLLTVWFLGYIYVLFAQEVNNRLARRNAGCIRRELAQLRRQRQ